MLEPAVMLSEISNIAGSTDISRVHHFTLLVISPMRYDPGFSNVTQFAESGHSFFFSNIVHFHYLVTEVWVMHFI